MLVSYATGEVAEVVEVIWVEGYDFPMLELDSGDFVSSEEVDIVMENRQ